MGAILSSGGGFQIRGASLGPRAQPGVSKRRDDLHREDGAIRPFDLQFEPKIGEDGDVVIASEGGEPVELGDREFDLGGEQARVYRLGDRHGHSPGSRCVCVEPSAPASAVLARAADSDRWDEMDATKTEALMTARGLIRTLESAPNPLRQARTAVTALVRAEGWGPSEERAILEVAEWLSRQPPLVALKPRCQQLLKRLG